MKVRVKVDARTVMDQALEFAIARGIRRCDKYAGTNLTAEQVGLLTKEVSNSFWLYIDDEGVELR